MAPKYAYSSTYSFQVDKDNLEYFKTKNTSQTVPDEMQRKALFWKRYEKSEYELIMIW